MFGVSRTRILGVALATVLLATGCTARSTAGDGSWTGRPRTLTVIGAGDVLVHPPVWQQARADARAEGRDGLDFDPIFAGVKPAVSGADLAICHLETPLAPADGPYQGWPRFAAPPQVLTAVRHAGFDDCSTASNHSYDQGTEGVDRTLDDLDAAGLHHSGTARSAAEAATPDLIDVDGVRVADLAYTFGLNDGITLPAGKPWLVNTTDVSTILHAAHRARQRGAQIVILSLHWGTEYQQAPTGLQIKQAHQLLASPDVDLILGCHAHVVQPFEKIDGKWVIYGMGNEIARHDDPVPASRAGVMPKVTFTRSSAGHWRVTSVEAIPTWVDIDPKIRLVDLPAALAGDHLTTNQRATYEGEYKVVARTVRSRGADVTIAPAR